MSQQQNDNKVLRSKIEAIGAEALYNMLLEYESAGTLLWWLPSWFMAPIIARRLNRKLKRWAEYKEMQDLFK